MKLYYSRNLNPRVALAVARYLHSPVDFVRASPRHPEHEQAFRAVNPNALVPVLVEDDRALWETDAIACRLSSIAKSDFWPTSANLIEDPGTRPIGLRI
jgi:glutathione S-transferase